MKLLVDMYLAPRWRDVLQGQGWDAVHWSEVGTPGDPDEKVMA